MIKSQRVMWWRLILKDFVSTIQKIYGFDYIKAYRISRLSSTRVDKYKPITVKDQC